MPSFDAQSRKRISAVVRHVEAQGLDVTGQDAKFRGGSPLVWFLLTEDFDADDNNRAKANPGMWTATANSGDGALEAEPVAWYYVRDTTGQSGAGEGDWVMCRAIGSENGTVWEVVTCGLGFDRCTGTLAQELTSAEGPFLVDLVRPISGASPLGDPTSATETIYVHNTLTWTADDGAICRIEWNRTEKRWEFYQVKCPA